MNELKNKSEMIHCGDSVSCRHHEDLHLFVDEEI